MTIYELIEATQIIRANLISNFIGFTSIISGYLVVAYLVGAKLTKSQFYIVNGLYISLTVLLLIFQAQLFVGATELYARLLTLDPTWPEQIEPFAVYITTSVWIAIVGASLKFMFDARNNPIDP